jgi:hypothetical protein
MRARAHRRRTRSSDRRCRIASAPHRCTPASASRPVSLRAGAQSRRAPRTIARSHLRPGRLGQRTNPRDSNTASAPTYWDERSDAPGRVRRRPRQPPAAQPYRLGTAWQTCCPTWRPEGPPDRTAGTAARVAASLHGQSRAVNGRASNSGGTAFRRSTGKRLRKLGVPNRAPSPGSSQSRSAPSFDRAANSARTTQDGLLATSCETISATSRPKSSRPPRHRSSHTSSTRKSRDSSWIRHGRDVWAVDGSLIQNPYGNVSIR